MSELNRMNDQEMENVVGGKLTQEEALTAALTHAKLSKDQVRVKKVDRDYEHGFHIYEISFVCNGFEYEYEIDAESGRILKAEKEFWD